MPPVVPLTLIRRILPSNEFTFWALLFGSPVPPPSPTPMYRYPKLSKAIIPPLWLVLGWWMVSSRRELVRTATSGLVGETLYWLTATSPFCSVQST